MIETFGENIPDRERRAAFAYVEWITRVIAQTPSSSKIKSALFDDHNGKKLTFDINPVCINNDNNTSWQVQIKGTNLSLLYQILTGSDLEKEVVAFSAMQI